nr:MAG TPA: hypothetical protein [Caudoviricetes sp.]
MEKAKKDRKNANIYSVIDKHYRKKPQKEAAKAVWIAGVTGLTLTIFGVGLCVLIMSIMLVTNNLDSEFFAKYFFLAIALVCVYYLPSRGMRRIDDTVKASAWTSMFLSILGIVSILGIWQLIMCIKAVRRLKDYKPLNQDKLSAKDVIIRSNAISDIVKKTLIVLAIIVGVVIVMGLLSELGKPKADKTTGYSSSTLNTVYGDDQFSVKLSENARKDKDTQGEDGVTISGSIYSDILANNKVMVKVGCLAYTQNGSELSIAKRETIDYGFNDEVKELRDKSYMVTETSRKYDDTTGGLISGFLEASLERNGSQNTLRSYISTRRNQMCMVYVIAPGNLVDQIYGDVMGTFTIR